MREITFDTETTGLDPKNGDRVVEIGCVELIDKIRTGKSYHVYIHPDREVPQASTDIHGLTNEFLKDKPRFTEIGQDFLDFIADDKLVIHNAAFDMKFINFELEKAKLKTIDPTRAIDTLDIAKRKFPGSKVNLNALCNRFDIDLSKRTKHGALLDAELLADVYLELILGEKQSSLTLNAAPETGVPKIESAQNKYDNIFREPRDFSLSEEEIKKHKEFLGNIKNHTWES